LSKKQKVQAVVLTQFFRELTEKEEVCSYFTQDCATAAAQQIS